MAPSQKYHRRLACAVCRLRQSAGEQSKTVAVLKRTWRLGPPCNLTGPGVRSQESGARFGTSSFFNSYFLVFRERAKFARRCSLLCSAGRLPSTCLGLPRGALVRATL